MSSTDPLEGSYLVSLSCKHNGYANSATNLLVLQKGLVEVELFGPDRHVHDHSKG